MLSNTAISSLVETINYPVLYWQQLVLCMTMLQRKHISCIYTYCPAVEFTESTCTEPSRLMRNKLEIIRMLLTADNHCKTNLLYALQDW